MEPTNSIEELDNLTRKALLERATTLGLDGLEQASKARILAAVKAAVALTETIPALEKSKPTQRVALQDEKLHEQMVVIRAADTQKLLKLLEGELPDNLRAIAERELKNRALEAAHAARQSGRSQIQRFVVVQGGRFVVPGHITRLNAGEVISAATHNLDEVKRQGIVFAPVSSVVTTRDELGRQQTRTR